MAVAGAETVWPNMEETRFVQGFKFRVQGFEGKGAGDQGLEVRVEGFMVLGF